MSNVNPQIVAAFQRLKMYNPAWLDAIELRPAGSQWRRWKCDANVCTNLEMLRQPTSQQWRQWHCHWERRATWEELAALLWELMEDSQRIEGLHRPDCLYYHCTKGIDATATEHIKLLSEFKNFDSIYINQGPHGIELLSHEVEEVYTQQAWLIIGPYSNETNDLVVYTAYPGRMACSVSNHPLWDGTSACLPAIAATNLPIAVKGVNTQVIKRTLDGLGAVDNG